MGETITDESSVTEVVKDNVPVVETMTAQPVAEAVKEVADTEKVASEPVVEVEKEEPAKESTQPEPIIESIKEEPSVESITINTDIIKKDVEEIVDQDKASKQLEDSELNTAALASVAASTAAVGKLLSDSQKKEDSDKKKANNMKRLQRIVFIIKWAIKLGIIKVTLDYTIEKGVWGDAEAGEKVHKELSKFMHGVLSENVSKEASEIVQNLNMGQMWNSAVTATIQNAKDVDINKMYLSLKEAVADLEQS